jgi:ribose-phosphate pyrophosphokinase
MKLKVVGGPSSTKLAEQISLQGNLPMVKVSFKRFPDGEFYFRFDEDIEGQDLLIVQSLYPPSDAHIIELLMILHGARDLKAASIGLFIPYLAYSRQDQRYLSGETISSTLLADLIQAQGASYVYTVDVHNKAVLCRYRIPAFNLTASRELALYFRKKGLRDPVVIAPDAEEDARERARMAAEAIEGEFDCLTKQRDRQTGKIRTLEKSLRVSGRDAIVIDDIISTGGTAANAVRILKKQGARRVFVGATHALLMGNALELLKEAGAEEVVGTDSVPSEVAKVTTAGLILKALEGAH